MGRTRIILTLSAVCFLNGCGGSSPTSPSVPVIPVTVTDVRNGITGAAVQANIQPSAGGVTVTAPGFLAREQAPANPVWLWPQGEEYVRQTVYSEFMPGQRLARWAPGSTLRLSLGSGLDGDQQAAVVLESCASELARWSRLPVVVGFPANVTLEINANAVDAVSPTALAKSSITFQGSSIVGALISFRSREIAVAGPRRNTMLHELGHVLGLGHSPIQTDVMTQLANRNDSQSFGGDEAAALTMMYQWRKAGNVFPDREPVGAASSVRRVEVIVD